MELYSPDLTLAEARDQHFARGGFSEAQYTARVARFRVGRFSIWLPNTSGRARALPYHDLHHVLTEYPTTWRGEAEIAAWELASGCGRYATAWLINLSASGLGLLIAPRAVWRAFRRGRRSDNLYGEPIAQLLSQTLGEVRRRLRLDVVPDGAVESAGMGMTRRLLNLLTALSLLLCVAVCVLWVWTASTMRWVGYATGHRVDARQAQHVLGSGAGALSYQCYLAPVPPRPGSRWFRAQGLRAGSYRVSRNELTDWADAVGVRFLGFGYYHWVNNNPRHTSHPQGMTFVAVFVPQGFVAAVFAAGPAARVTLRILLRRGRTPAGLCPKCGYDLRATPGRCPECGTEKP